ncbi:MAG TPA: hypothetical protein VE377_13085 [Candidatus Dormibacteraeota bacterium]|nr:hypothetical protein [Candidatus Dormibacteraeota bacterium]
MNQVLNIFRKDIRHHWKEIAASLALLLGFMWMQLQEWAHSDVKAYDLGSIAIFGFLGQLVVPLVPISWMFLIVRAVQGESLVGDRQFWITRPYDWKNLAAAKLLFILAFISLPLFIADIFLLAKAGFSPLSYVGPLFWLQLIWMLILFLPTAALAAVTRSIGQMLLALLFVVVFVIALSALSEAISNSGFANFSANVIFLLTIATVSAVLLQQYSLRKTGQSRLMLVGLAAAIALVLVATPYRTLIAHEYPLATAASAPLHLTLLPPPPPSVGSTYNFGNNMPVHLSFSVSGLPKDSFVLLNGRIITLTNSRGAHWDSGWLASRMPVFPDQSSMSADFYMKNDEYDRLKSSPVHAHLLLAFTVFHDKDQNQLIVPSGEFFLPGYGFCSASPRSWAAASCRVPLRIADYLVLTEEMAKSTCPLGKNETPANPGDMARQFLENEGPVEPGISPVGIKQVILYDWTHSDRRIPGVCPGTPLTVSYPEETGHTRIELDFDNLPLPDRRPGSDSPGFFGSAIILGH